MQTNGVGGLSIPVLGQELPLHRWKEMHCSPDASTSVFQKMLQLKTPICYSTFMHKVKLRQMIPLA